MEQLKSHGKWSGKWTFILAATGSAVGLGIYGDFLIWLAPMVVEHLF